MNVPKLIEILMCSNLSTLEKHEISEVLTKYQKIDDAVTNWSINHYHTHDYMKLIESIIESNT